MTPKAVFALNSRIQYTQRSACELLFKRDQYSGSSIEVDDDKISAEQKEKRKKDNVTKSNELNRRKLREKITGGKHKTGDLVFVISDRNKHGRRDVYMIMEVEEDKVSVVKVKQGITSRKKYIFTAIYRDFYYGFSQYYTFLSILALVFLNPLE